MNKRWLVLMSAMAQFGCPFLCIARGAKVKTPRGEVSVEDLVVGDEVVVIDPVTRESHTGRITVVRSAKRECGRLDGLRLTSSHPLYDPEKHEWAPAGDWLLGLRTTLQTLDGPKRVLKVERFVGVDDVFDLTVDHPLHTFVADGVVVHNKSPPRAQCLGADGALVFEFNECACPHPDETGFLSCPFDAGVAECNCSSSVSFYSDWRSANGTSAAAVRDGSKWTLEPCSADAGLQVAVQPDSPARGNALVVSPGACGRLTHTTTTDKLRTGSLWVRAAGPVTAPTPILTADDVVLFGLAPGGDGGVRLFTGSPDAPALAAEQLDAATWHHFTWEFDVTGGVARVFPRVSLNAPVLNAAQFRAPDDSATLVDWYQSGNAFQVVMPPTQLRLGVEQPGDVDVRFGEVTLGTL